MKVKGAAVKQMYYFGLFVKFVNLMSYSTLVIRGNRLFADLLWTSTRIVIGKKERASRFS